MSKDKNSLEDVFKDRFYGNESPRQDDERDEYMRDKSRIVHSAAFRRLQGKTQVMGAGEGDFHRTRLTHSLEVAQIGQGIVKFLGKFNNDWLPDHNLITASCYAHDLGHPPFGHGGEKALQSVMVTKGGFEGNAQTLRLLTKLEKYLRHQGVNPTRRTILSILKYPVCYTEFNEREHLKKPPKCYFQTEASIIDWCLEPFSKSDRSTFAQIDKSTGKPKYKTFDASIMEHADDIAFASHDVEDAIARGFVKKDEFTEALRIFMKKLGTKEIGAKDKALKLSDFEALFETSYERKRSIGKLVNLFVTSLRIEEKVEFDHPLLRHQSVMDADVEELRDFLNDEIVGKMVIQKAELQMLEAKGQRLIQQIFEEMIKQPERLIPANAWDDLDPSDTEERRVCDYIAGMTDAYAEKVYHRLFTPGYGSSRDEM